MDLKTLRELILIQEAVEEGTRLRDSGDWAAALSQYARARTLVPENPVPLIYEASALNLLDRYDDAMRCCETAARLDPHGMLKTIELEPGLSLEAFRLELLGVAHREFGQLVQAVDCYKQAIALSPRFHIAWLNLAVAQAQQGEIAQARTSVDKAIEILPSYEKARHVKKQLASIAPL